MKNEAQVYNIILDHIADMQHAKTIESLNHKLAYIDGELFISQFLISQENLNDLYQKKEDVYEIFKSTLKD